MFASDLFERIPLKDNYKVMHEDFVRLKGPPYLVRICFLFELAVAAAAFAISFTLSITSTTTETSITYETLGSSYVCNVLSPRSDTKYLSETTSELMQFSSARFLLDECLEILDTDGLDVCSDDNRKDYILSIQGIAANKDNCFDIILKDGYRFCYGSEVNTKLRGDLDTVFPRQSLDAPPLRYDDTFYYMKENGIVHAVSAPFTKDGASTIFVYEDGYIYVVAKNTADSNFYLYQFSPSLTTAAALLEINGGTFTGIAVSDSYVFVMKEANSKAEITAYKFADGTSQIINVCDASALSSSDKEYQLIATGEDGSLYVMCSIEVVAPYYTFYKVDPGTFEVSALYTDANSLSLEDNDDTVADPPVNQVKTLVVIGNYAYFSTQENNFNLLKVDLTPQPTNAPTIMPTPMGSPAPTIAPINAGPSPGQQAVSLGDIVSIASNAYKRILMSALTSVILHVSGLNDTETAVSLHKAVAERTGSKQLSTRMATESGYFAPTSRRLSAPLQSIENLGPHLGGYLHKTLGDLIYFQDGNNTYYNTSSGEFGYFSEPDNFYKTTAVQIAYVYAICNGVVVSNWTISTGTTTAFYDACDDINGIYYQNNQFISVPEDCQGMFSNTEGVNSVKISSCPSLAALVGNFTSIDCADSFEDVCQAEYTDNPPYSCTKETTAAIITVLGTSLANASALWSFTAIVISLSLKRIYPGGIFYKEYKEQHAKEKQQTYKATEVVPISAEAEMLDRNNEQNATAHA